MKTALIFAIVIVLFTMPVFASGQRPTQPSPSARDNTEEGDLAGAISQTQPLPVLNEIFTTKYCPICGRTFSEGTQVCPVHGVALKYKSQRGQVMPSESPQTQAKPAVKFCPACGRQYPADNSYCIVDGNKLEVIR
ncbi:MAG: hypothetical protein ABIH01_02450 [Candidatus Omnitrophota bacterium]